ncbi:peptide N-acetyl-beta-D-glucosaminyl asparaginase amidase A-domain-containing protein [Cytidiella melzeri]|nr:peptide N-acetyl-beta-D-glucosaminyl asparaginase amidase A-domain-containing protein [Cytidiella melzeri]
MKLSAFVAPLLLAACTSAARLVDFQVAQPPPLPKDAKQCTIQILERTFAFSFGDAEVVQFTPPTDCGPVGSWAGISLNFTVTSNGTQFDRLGIFTFQNVEIWRTSTPEPTIGDGIIWTYLKDVTRFLPLFSEPGTFILQLDNLIETGLDGEYATTLHATFFESSIVHPPAPRANVIIPVTTLSNTTGDDASVPPAFSLNVTVPRNAVQVYAELLPSGNGNEEFWYFNTANQFLGDLPAGFSFPDGPLREVRLLVDGRLAGAALPPITSYGALDLPTYFIDLTPFVPVLTDGNPHNITIDVSSAESDHAINQNWFVSGNLQVVTDPSGKPTTGSITVYDASPFPVTTTTGTLGTNGDLVVTVAATHSIHIESHIVSGSGKTTNVVWTQQLSYSNTQSFLDNLLIQNVLQTSEGQSTSLHNGVSAVVDKYSFPFAINITSLTPDGSTSGFFQETSSGNFGNGTSTNTFSYSDTKGNTYQRQVSSVNTNITSDHQSGTLAPLPASKGLNLPQAQAKFSIPRLPGGRHKPGQ